MPFDRREEVRLAGTPGDGPMGTRDGGAAARRFAPDRASAVAELVNVLECDPDLGAALPRDDFGRAVQASLAYALELDPGLLPFGSLADTRALGWLVLSGVLVVRQSVAERRNVELLGAGDVVMPWLLGEPGATIASSIGGEVVSPTRVAVLDRRFAARLAPWPEVSAALMGRLALRARRLSQQSALNAIPRVQERLEMTLWGLADRFGRMTREGVVVELPLTHAQLAEMIGAQRPSVTTSLTALQRRGRLERLGRRTWRLCGEPPREEPVRWRGATALSAPDSA